ncbi:F-BAR domain only protein 1 isoform X2 [Anguilla anguilla]|uniref:F-BAR domain only protein 1 isoform X2 n=1 Tax=Anguilla anguilla TaxID=7936 RepID=UPI0015A99A96|nr:F-BAR domain only protein 1 isoform X2 [Anguilla anguilla]
MALFKNNFWGEKNAGFDVLYHNMKHGHICTKELAEFVRERAAIEETYSKSMSKLAKMACNGSPLGTFAPMWDVFRVSSDKLALCHLELTKKMNDLIRDVSKYGEEQVKVHRKTKEELLGTVEAVQALQAQSAHLQKSREVYHGKCVELERLQREGAPQKEVEKMELKVKKAGESFAACIEKYNRVGGDFEQKMSDSAQKFQDIEEAHLRQMKQLIKAYSHSIEDTHVQVGQVHEEFKQNVENIGIENLLQKFAELKGTGKDRPAAVGFEGHSSSLVPDAGKRSRGKAFRIPGLSRRDKEPDSTESAVTGTQNSPEVDEEGFVIRADVTENGCAQEKEKDGNFYSSDSDFDDDEPKKFRIQIRPVGSGGRGSSVASEMELRATVGTLTLPPNRGVSAKRQLSRNSSCTAGPRSEGEGDSAPRREGERDRRARSTASSDRTRLSSTVSGSEALFGPPLESACKSSSLADPAFSSDSSSPENVEDSGLDSPSHQPLGPSPEPASWAAWPSAPQSRGPAVPGRTPDPFLSAFPDPPTQREPACPWAPSPGAPDPAFGVPAFGRSLAPPEPDPTVWTCRHIPPQDAFLAAFEEAPPSPPPWGPPPPCRSRGGKGPEAQRDPRPSSSSSSSCSSSARADRDPIVPVLDSPEDPFSITMIGSPTHQAAQCGGGGRTLPPSGSAPQPKRERAYRGSVGNPFSEGGAAGGRDGERKERVPEEEPVRNGLPLTRSSELQNHLNTEPCPGTVTPPPSQHGSTELLGPAPARPARATRTLGPLSGPERSRSVCSSPLPGPSPGFTTSSSSSSPSEWAGQTTSTPRPSSPARGLSRGPSPLSLSAQEAWPVAAALTEYINAYFKGGEQNRCLVKITGDLTMSFPAGIARIFAANPNTPVLSFRLVNTARVDQFLPNQKLLFSDPSQSDPGSRDYWFNMQALTALLQREAQLNPQASYYNVTVLKYQVSAQDSDCAPVLLLAECQRSGTVTRVSLDYRCSPAVAPGAELSGVQVLLPLDPSATDPQCQPPASWNAEERRLLWKLPNLSPTSNSKGSGTLCASWQCLEAPRGPPPSLAVQFTGSGAALSGLGVELVGGRYRMSLVKKRFATGKYMAGCSL